MIRRLATVVLAVAVCTLAFPSRAEAHLVTTGLGPVFDGVGHLFLTLEDLLPVVALALFAGLRGAPSSRAVLFVLPAAWLAGGVAGLGGGVQLPQLAAAGSLIIFGGLLAADRALPRPWVSGLAILLGLLHGSMNGAAMRQASLGLLGLVGVGVSIFVVVALASALVLTLRASWTRVAVRVVGSWVVATGLLLLGWWVRAGA